MWPHLQFDTCLVLNFNFPYFTNYHNQFTVLNKTKTHTSPKQQFQVTEKSTSCIIILEVGDMQLLNGWLFIFVGTKLCLLPWKNKNKNQNAMNLCPKNTSHLSYPTSDCMTRWAYMLKWSTFAILLHRAFAVNSLTHSTITDAVRLQANVTLKGQGHRTWHHTAEFDDYISMARYWFINIQA